jgi:uncharacterized protein (TIGR03437 family)
LPQNEPALQEDASIPHFLSMDAWKLGRVFICLLTSQGLAAAATTLITGTTVGPYRSTDGGVTWQQIFMDASVYQRLGLPKLVSLAVDPQNPANVYAGASFTGVNALLRSGDGGQTWSIVTQTDFGFDGGPHGLAIDPVMPNVIYVSTPQHELQVSTDGGLTWIVPSMPNPSPGLKTSAPDHPSLAAVAVDPKHTGVVYVIGPDGDTAKRNGYILTSLDYGKTWTVLGQSLNFSGRIFVDPGNSQILYGTNVGSSVGIVCNTDNGGKCGLYKSTDAGKTWAATSMPRPLVQSVAVDPAANMIYAWADGGASDVTSGAPGGLYKSHNAGVTWTQALQNMGVATFGKVARVDPSNPGTVYSLGPTGGDAVSRSVDSGVTWTAVHLPTGCDRATDKVCFHDVIIQDLVIVPSGSASPGAIPSISANGVVNAATYQPGIVANSWTSILGTNLAPRTDDWSHSFVDGKLPVSLDGVSVTIGGKPAAVAFISSGQVNVLAPDLPAGPATVTVTTPGGQSAAFAANVTVYSPSFFAWGNQVVATRQDYSLAAKAGTFPGAATTPAKPGDVLVLWGMGFGPTSPAPPSGVPVPSDRIYGTATLPAVTINNIPATVFGAALAPGAAGLFQVAIQVPDTLADGDWPVQANIGGATSPAGTILSIHR